MHKYLVLSIPVVAALIVGFIAYQVKLASLEFPSEEDIRNAPDDRPQPVGDEATDEGEDFFKEWEKRWEAKQKGGRVDTPAPTEEKKPAEPTAAAHEPRVRKPTKGQLRVQRKNAYITARQTGATAALVTLILGYVALGASLVYLGKKRPKSTWRDAVSASAHRTEDAVTHGIETGYDAPAASVPPPLPQEHPIETIDDEAPYEPYEAPIDITELEQAHDDSQPDDRGT